mgnify:CR=1 FL=1
MAIMVEAPYESLVELRERDEPFVVIDRDLHLRRVKVSFDFDAAAGWDEDGLATGNERSVRQATGFRTA